MTEQEQAGLPLPLIDRILTVEWMRQLPKAVFGEVCAMTP